MTKDIPFKDISQDLLDDIDLHLQSYSVSIYVSHPQEVEPHISPIGSGTLVEIAGSHHILTAAHVWEGIEAATEVGLTLTPYPSHFTIKREAIIPAEKLGPAEPSDINHGGPDLALLRLAPSDVFTIKAHKSFVNLAREKGNWAVHAPNTEKGLWVIKGMVQESSLDIAAQGDYTMVAHVSNKSFCGGVTLLNQCDGYDYLDLKAAQGLPGMPSSFVGVSGGGLWEIGLQMATSGEIKWDNKPHFRGVEFAQLPVSQGQRMIRCHGPRSIFEKAWEAWKLPFED